MIDAASLFALFGTVNDPSTLADQPIRRRLLEIIAANPGIHASKLCRDAGGPWGTVQYHLSLLNKGQMVRAVDAGRERRFFPNGMDPTRARLMAILRQGRRPEIVQFIRSHPGSRQVDICDALDVSRKTFRASVQPLMQEGLVQERRGLQSNRYFPLDGLQAILQPGDPPATDSAVPAPSL